MGADGAELYLVRENRQPDGALSKCVSMDIRVLVGLITRNGGEGIPSAL